MSFLPLPFSPSAFNIQHARMPCLGMSHPGPRHPAIKLIIRPNLGWAHSNGEGKVPRKNRNKKGLVPRPGQIHGVGK